jgi:transketolase
MRTAFIRQLIEEAKINDKIFLLVADLGFSVVEPFAEQFPSRYLNVGVAEQNMAGIAAGLAMEGFHVYIYSIGNFPTLRCIEQIRYDICYHNLPVNIVAVGGGYAYGALGPSHHATEEVGMLRTIPNLVVCAPGDPEEAKAVTIFTARLAGPSYIRLGKAGEPTVHPAKIGSLKIGHALPVIIGKNTAILTTGAMLKNAVDFVKEHELPASVYSFPFIKPLNVEMLLTIFKSYSSIITLEEHQLQGGFGSAILEVLHDCLSDNSLSQNSIPRIRRIGIQDKFFSVAGSQEFLRKKAGIELRKEYFNL